MRFDGKKEEKKRINKLMKEKVVSTAFIAQELIEAFCEKKGAKTKSERISYPFTKFRCNHMLFSVFFLFNFKFKGAHFLKRIL